MLFIPKLLLFLPIFRYIIKKFKYLRHWIHDNTKWWNFLTMTIEGNLIVIVFEASLQLLAPSYLNFMNKINFLIGLLFLFIACIYASLFYELIYKY